MSIYFINKLIVAFVVALSIFTAVRFVGEQFFPDKPIGEFAYVVDISTSADIVSDSDIESPSSSNDVSPTNTTTVSAISSPQSFGDLIRQSDASAGEKQTAICRACHSFIKGGPTMLGPNLWDIVGRDKASMAGYTYSPAFQALSGAWTFDDLDTFLENPGQYATGTKMSYAGVKNDADRAALIAFLRLQADAPSPLPNN